MNELTERYNHLSRITKWCEQYIKKIQESYLNDKIKDEKVKILTGFKKDCHILCRQIQLIRDNEDEKATDRIIIRCDIIRFNKFDIVKQDIICLGLK